MRFSLQSHSLHLCQAVPENPTVPAARMGMAVNVTGFVQLKTNTKIKIASLVGTVLYKSERQENKTQHLKTISGASLQFSQNLQIFLNLSTSQVAF